MGKVFDMQKVSGVAIASVVGVMLVALVTYGATTISTSINTGGTLTVSGLSALASATFSSTINVTGNATFDTSSLFVDATNHRVGAGTITPNTTLEVVGSGTAATSASTTSLIIGGNTGGIGLVKGMVFGTCDLTQLTVTASTSRTLICTPTSGVINTNFKVFVQATSTLVNGDLAYNGEFSVSSASSTAAGAIGVLVYNSTGANKLVSGTLNFWAIR